MSDPTITLQLDGIDLEDLICAVAACKDFFNEQHLGRYVSITIDIEAGTVEVRASELSDLFYLGWFHGLAIGGRKRKEIRETWNERLARAKREKGGGE